MHKVIFFLISQRYCGESKDKFIITKGVKFADAITKLDKFGRACE